MQPRAILIEKNPHLRDQLADTMQRLGFALVCADDTQPSVVVFSLKQAHAGRWHLVRQLLALSAPPVLIALAPVDVPAIRQSALENGVDFVFDPLLELDGFLSSLRQIASATQQLAS